MLGLGAVPALALLIGMLRMPQSPRWLVMVGEDYKARLVLSRIRSDDGRRSTRSWPRSRRASRSSPAAGATCSSRPSRPPCVIGVGLAILQQVTGINTVIYYAPTIIEYTGVSSGSSAILASLGVGVVNVIATIVALRLIDTKGRRTLLFVGVAGMTASLVALGGAFLGDETGTLITVVAIASLMAYVAAFAISLGPIFWLLNSEIYPLNVRSKAAAAGTMANWTFNFIVSLTFLLLIDELGQSGTFFFYAAVGLFTLWFCWKLVPETKGKRLEDIEEIFKQRAAGKS